MFTGRGMVPPGEAFVATASGELRGALRRSCLGDEYRAFKGIPYARPPVGPLRFRDPEPVEPWTGVRDATEHGPICLQICNKTGSLIGSEDCLYLNVYARNVDPKLRQPVMVWIHGGGFLSESGNEDAFGPDYFMSKSDIVLVTLNYRLGVFGFLNLLDETAPGNQGLKDQVMALQWIKNNIFYFGGDPDNVTIFGQSSGAACVHYLTLSPMAKGLFHKAICQSGTILNPWALISEPKKSLNDLLKQLGCKERDPKAVLAFLRKVDSGRLAMVQGSMCSYTEMLTISLPFGPCVDSRSSNPFMPIHPCVLVEEGVQVPLMLGYTALEGLYWLNYLNVVGIEEFKRNFENFVLPFSKHVLRRYNLTLQELKQLYFGSETISEKNLQKLAELYGDLGFVEGIHKLIKIQFHNSAAPTYLYQFSYTKNKSIFTMNLDVPFKGAGHGDDLIYLFTKKAYEAAELPQLQDDTGAFRVMTQMIELWTNFAKLGRPMSAMSDIIPLYWQPSASDVILRYLNIDEELHMEKTLNIDQRYSYKQKGRYLD